MSTQERRARERAAREATILRAARELAESDGWAAVTTRRLADRIEYSQPVLYSHFAGKDAIVAAVAREGFVELAVETRGRARAAGDARTAVEGVVAAYLDFARTHPALYAAMFSTPVDLPFAAADTPTELREGFAALRDPLAALLRLDPDGEEIRYRTELLWSTLHGLATLTAGGRIPAGGEPALVARLVGSLAPTA